MREFVSELPMASQKTLEMSLEIVLDYDYVMALSLEGKLGYL